MKYICEFVGGKRHGQRFDMEIAELFSNGKSEDLSELRAQGVLVHRAELDNKPTFEGYLGPMWDGIRYNGKSEWQATDKDKAMYEPVAVLRYETQEVYDMMFN